MEGTHPPRVLWARIRAHGQYRPWSLTMSFLASLNNTAVATAGAATTTVTTVARTVSLISTGVEFGALHLDTALERSRKILKAEAFEDDTVIKQTALTNLAFKLDALQERLQTNPRAAKIYADLAAKWDKA